MRGKLIIVAGYCATGKSTFARKLSGILNIPCFIKDTVKETIADGFGLNNDEVIKKGSAAAFGLMLHIAEIFLQTGKPCILEANFKPPEAEQIRKLAEKYAADCLTFQFTGDPDTLFGRYAARDEAGKRHWVHLRIRLTDGDRERFIQTNKQIGYDTVAIGRTIRVDATDFGKVDYDGLYREAGEFVVG
jgi:predicted kinase